MLGNGRKRPWFYIHRERGKVLTWGSKPHEFFKPAVMQTELESRKILQGVWKRGVSTR